MSFDISVFIWTLIDFAALYLVLNFLLIKPLFKVMDKRKAKVDAAASAKAERQKAKALADEKRAAEYAAAKAQALQAAKEAEAKRNEKRRADLEAKAISTAENVSRERANLAKQSEDFLACRKTELDDTAQVLADTLIGKEAQ